MASSTLTNDNCLSIVSKDLSEEWDFEFNYPLTPKDVTFDDYKPRGWVCKKCGNKWTAIVNQRYIGLGKCLKCRSIGLLRKDLIKEWDNETNYPLTPFDFTPGSSKRVGWKCGICGNKWIAIIKNRCIGHGCPSCKHRRLSLLRSTPKNNSLMTMNPQLSLQWHPTKNGNLKPQDICCHSNRSVWWKCPDCNYEWESIINIRMKSKYQSCPKHPLLLPFKKSLSFLDPDLAREFNGSNNPHITPDNLSLGSKWIIHWKCGKCGYSWDGDVYSRVRGYNNCPNCCDKITLKNGIRCASLIEAYYYLKYRAEKKKFLHNKKYGGLGKFGNCRYDFYLPAEQTYVEVTSFQKGFKRWFAYLRRIVVKKLYVENVLKKKFLFIKENLTTKQIRLVNNNRQKYSSFNLSK